MPPKTNCNASSSHAVQLNYKAPKLLFRKMGKTNENNNCSAILIPSSEVKSSLTEMVVEAATHIFDMLRICKFQYKLIHQ